MSFRSPRHRARSATVLLAVLAAFLLGTNYCLLAALGSPRLACHAPVSAQANEGAHCCQGNPADDSSAPQRPAAGFPCCIQVAPPASVDFAKPDLDHALFAVLDAALESSRTSPTARHDFAWDEAAPPETIPDLLRGRAPPLS